MWVLEVYKQDDQPRARWHRSAHHPQGEEGAPIPDVEDALRVWNIVKDELSDWERQRQYRFRNKRTRDIMMMVIM